MPDVGANIALRFSVSQQHAVHANEIPQGNIAIPDITAFRSAVDGVFGGQMVKASVVRFRLTETEKLAIPDRPYVRRSRFDISGTFGDANDPSEKYGFYLPNLSADVSDTQIQDLILGFCQLPNGNPPTIVFLGLREYRA